MAEAKQVRRMPAAQRREQILAAATRAFARGGFAATGLDDVAAEAGITRVLLYRHFDSKESLYREVLDEARRRLTERVGVDDFDEGSIPALLRSAAANPDGFRLMFRHAAREPEFRGLVDELNARSVEVAHRNLIRAVPDGPWTRWAAQLLPAITVDAVIAWLDAGQPDPDTAPARIDSVVQGVIAAIRID